ncbi:MAG: aldose epimerase family protein [Pseudomonadota bacterium]
MSTATVFGTTAAGAPVHRYSIGAGAIEASLLSRGAVLHDVRLSGVPFSVTLGYDTLAPYEDKMGSCGAIVGPVANRIAGAAAMIDGVLHRFDAGGPGPILHGGAAALHNHIWDLVDHGADHLTLRVLLPHGEGGFPGNRTIDARFEVLAPATLRLTIDAMSDRVTILNLANHSYWRLSDAPTLAGHSLQIAADHYLPVDGDLIPTGAVAPVADTRFDYRRARPLDAGAEGLLDTNFCLSDARMDLRAVAWLRAPTGLNLEVATTEPGLQIFDGHILGRIDAPDTDGRRAVAYAALAMEPQFWPDAPNHAAFPSIDLPAETPWQQITEWRFSGLPGA